VRTRIAPRNRMQMVVTALWLVVVLTLSVVASLLITALRLPPATPGPVSMSLSEATRQAQDNPSPATAHILTAEDSPWPAGGRIYQVTGDTRSYCSVGFSFTAGEGHPTGYAVTAGHCGGIGQPISDDTGTVIGEIVATGKPEQDWALIRIIGDSPLEPVAPGTMRPAAPPAHLLLDPLPGPRAVTLMGSTSGSEYGVILPSSGDRSTLMSSTACGRGGDSGGAAVVTSRGWLDITVGLVSTGGLDCAGEPRVTSAGPLREYAGSGIAQFGTLIDQLDTLAPGARFTFSTVTL
jgi:hypothetical protein